MTTPTHFAALHKTPLYVKELPTGDFCTHTGHLTDNPAWAYVFTGIAKAPPSPPLATLRPVPVARLLSLEACGTGADLSVKYGPDGEHPLFPRAEWRRAVAEDRTDEGYWSWAQLLVEAHCPLTHSEYVERFGNQCPHCRSEDTRDGDFDPDSLSKVLTQNRECLDCGHQWIDYYKLDRMEPVNVGGGCL